jgi:Arylsulfotransferase (ASST)
MKFCKVIFFALLICLYVLTSLTVVGCNTSDKVTPIDGNAHNNDDAGETDDIIIEPNPQIINESVYLNPRNFLTAIYDIEVDRPTTVYVEFGTNGDYQYSTPVIDVEANETTHQVVYSMTPETEYQLRAVVTATDGKITRADAHTIITGSWPTNWPLPSAIDYTDGLGFLQLGWTDKEAFCIPQMQGGVYIYTCFNRFGIPIWYFQHPDNFRFMDGSTVLQNGNWLSITEGPDGRELIFYDMEGNTLGRYTEDWFKERTESSFLYLHHDVIEITTGPWTGMIAFLIGVHDTVWFDPEEGIDFRSRDYLNYPYVSCTEPVETPMIADGIVVFDYINEKIVWEWRLHGATGDDDSISTKLPYTRFGVMLPEVFYDEGWDWTHGNAILHDIDDEGQFFWMSLRHQDWLIKISVATNDIVWRFGYQGDFKLVDNIDSPNPIEQNPDRWMYAQHAPEWQSHSDGRYDFLIFDNGNERASSLDNNYDIHYSRVVRYRLDENSMLADISFDYGSPDQASQEHFYSDAVGDANMQPNETSILFTKGFPDVEWSSGGSGDHNVFIAEILIPEKDMLWKLSVKPPADLEEMTEENNGRIYRANYFPSLYERTWWLDVQR